MFFRPDTRDTVFTRNHARGEILSLHWTGIY
jgi:hypothetical protein